MSNLMDRSKAEPIPLKDHFTQYQYQGGFTLVELMIVVVIAAVIAAIAMPAYSKYAREARRVEATSVLLLISNMMEKFHTDNSTYTNDLTLLGFNPDPFITENGSYSLEVDDNGGGGGACPIAGCFIINATAIGTQASDSECAVLTINSLGARFAVDDNNNPASNCW